MRGGVQLTVAVCVALLLTGKTSAFFRCSDRTPEGHLTSKSPVENKFQLKISGNPNTYEPGEKYTVILQGTRQNKIPHKFTGFFLTVHPADSLYETEPNSNVRDVGSFQPMLGDALTQISDNCPNAVTQTASISKSEIQVYWKAPAARPSGNKCVTFRATVVEDRYVWYQDDGPLTLTLCEDVQENINEQGEVLDRCCACDEAKYEVTFEGLWSRHTHPKDFPSNGWLTRFSDIIGASHSSDYRFWEYGKEATEGLRVVAETGSTRVLESELKSESEYIRTIIKARGISYPNVTGKTFAVFRVDKKHHLMSLVSMIEPSPDWIVGVSGLELCLRNCSWVEFKVLNLYPWDAGTDSGLTYISPDSPTVPQEPIRQITSRYPKDEASPFYDPTGTEMKPFARLYLTRQRLYEKSCTDDSISTDDEEPNQGDCAVTEWSEWEPCSVTCGRGVRYRQRSYVDQMLAEAKSCREKLTSKMICYGKPKVCREGYYHYGLTNENKETWDDDPSCQLTDWTGWSPCSRTCGHGVRTRSRKYKTRAARKRCLLLAGAPDLEQTIPCFYDDCDGDEEGEEEGDFNGEDCQVSDWSEWTPCSATCGTGTKSRIRSIITSDGAILSGDEDYINEDETCKDVELRQEVECSVECENSLEEAKVKCLLPLDQGGCRGFLERWYFDTATETCNSFIYTGCRGNKNNFLSKEDCEQTCFVLKDPSQSTTDQFGGLVAGNQIKGTQNFTYGIPSTAFTPLTIESVLGEVIDCKTTHWSPWSECSATCGKGMKERTRHILVNPQNGGKPCPKKLLKRKKCRLQRCDMVLSSPQDSNEDLPSWGGSNIPQYSERDDADCVMSQWSAWTPCSATCGLNAVMQRTRNIIILPGSMGRSCEERIETRPCNLLPCKF